MQLIRELHDTLNSNAKLIVFCDGMILYDQSKNDYLFCKNDLNDLDDQSPYLCIGIDGDASIYSISVPKEDNILGIFIDPKTTHFIDCRQLLSFLEPSQFQILSRASMLNSWKNNNNYCSVCGNLNKFNGEEGAYICDCSHQPIYPSISPCIITLVHHKNKILLGRNKFFPPNMYSTLAGFIEAGETAEEALVREVMEEVNVLVSEITYFHSQSWPFPSQLMLGYFCKYVEGDIALNDQELEDARWFDLNELPVIPPDTSISGQLIRSYISGRSKP